MTDNLLTDTELDALVASTTPFDDPIVAQVSLDAAAAALLAGICAAERPRDDVVAMPIRRPSRRRRTPRALEVAAAVVAVVAGSFVASDVLDRDQGTAWSAEMVAFAESTPRVLPTGGWEVDHLYDGEGSGEMDLTDGAGRLITLNWYPAERFDEYVADRAADGRRVDGVEVLGREVEAFDDGSFYALWVQGDRAIELRAYDSDEGGFRELAAGLREVGVDEWLEALPAGTVAPGERPEVIDEMVRGIPLPPGFDLGPVRDAERAGSRHSLGVELTRAIACGWGDVWTTATETGDADAVQRANAAMATSHDWPILHEMFEESGADVVWALADAMPSGTLVSGGGGEITVQELVQEICVPQ